MTDHMTRHPPPEDRRMSDSEILLRLDAIEGRLTARLDTIDTRTAQTLDQATKTNGRVDSLESWRDKANGVLIALALIQPVITAVLVAVLLDVLGVR